MRTIKVFNNVSLDGYFTDAHGDMSWAHRSDDPEWLEFSSANAEGGGELLFGRITYDLMVAFWPTPEAKQTMPIVAEGMNNSPKVVFSRTLDAATWNNTRLVSTDPVDEVERMKQEPGRDMVIMGSGTIVSQLAEARLIDSYQFVLTPLVLGAGRTLFEGVTSKLDLTLVDERRFANGNVVLWYEPTGAKA